MESFDKITDFLAENTKKKGCRHNDGRGRYFQNRRKYDTIRKLI